MSASAGAARPAPSGSAAGLGLGCAELYRLSSARARRRVLDAALDAGIAHFDVAPMYGLGVAEAEIGRFVQARRDRIVIATKFGIDVTATGRALAAIQGPVRRCLQARPGLDAAARSSGAGPASGAVGRLLYAAAGYDAPAARRSLHRSLRALGTDRVDLLLLHDPDPRQLSDDVAEHLEQLRAEGLIGTWGVAGEPADALATARRLTARAPVLQVRDDVFVRSLEQLPADPGQRRITFGTLGGALGPIVDHVRRDPRRRRAWSQRVQRDAGDPETVAALLLRQARRRNPDGLTLWATTRPERVAAAVGAAADGSADDEVDAFVALVAAQVAGPGRGAPAR